jgi:hypothetical protein
MILRMSEQAVKVSSMHAGGGDDGDKGAISIYRSRTLRGKRASLVQAEIFRSLDSWCFREMGRTH